MRQTPKDFLAGFTHHDSFSMPAQRPAGALVVTDEIAHQDRRSLKRIFAMHKAKARSTRAITTSLSTPKSHAELIRSLRGKRVQAQMWVQLAYPAATRCP